MSFSQGADSAMGSLITLLAVADILGNNTAAVATYRKRLVLTALVGEPWGYMGSKRLLWEMDSQADTTSGLSLEQIEQVSSLHATSELRVELPLEQLQHVTVVGKSLSIFVVAQQQPDDESLCWQHSWCQKFHGQRPD